MTTMSQPRRARHSRRNRPGTVVALFDECVWGSAPLASLAALAQRGAELAMLPDHAMPMACFAWMHALTAAARVAECAGEAPSSIRDALAPARSLHSVSPFVSRLQEWPEGYPGDWRTIEYLMLSSPTTNPGTLAHGIEWSALNTAIAQQHRNKVRWQADQIEVTVRMAPGGAATVLSIGCGGSADIALLPTGTGAGSSFTLADVDESALTQSAGVVARLGAKATLAGGNILRTLAKLVTDPTYDLVVCGGLLDYLTTRHAEWLVSTAWRGIKPGGRLAFTNLATGNPFRPWMEYIANWHLIERSEAELLDWVDQLPMKRNVTISQDPTGLAWLVAVEKARAS